jgi:hypothetical protein
MQILFGARIWELPLKKVMGVKIPEVLWELMEYFETFKEHKKEEGIFRKSCSQSRLSKMNFFLMFHDQGGYNCLKVPDQASLEAVQMQHSSMTPFAKA